MSYIDVDRPFFLQSTPMLALPDRYGRHFPETKDLQRGIFSCDDLNLPYFFSRAPNEKAVIVGCTGLNTHVLLRPQQVRQLNDKGISVIWLGLPPIDHDRPFMDDYRRMAELFFSHSRSPARVLFPDDIQRHVLTHSTGGQLYLSLKQDPDTHIRLQSFYTSETHIAPYLDSSNASRQHSPRINQWAFAAYSRLNLHRRPSETLLGRAYLAAKTLGEHYAKMPLEITPTYAHIRQVQQAGRSLTDTFNPQSIGNTPCRFILGERDPFACPKTGAMFAGRLGAEVSMVKGAGHNPLDHAADLFDEYVEKISVQAQTYLEQRRQREAPSPFWQGLEGSLSIDSAIGIWGRLSYRAGFALKSCARLLNTAAGFFESLFGRRVGDAEVRREPERNTLNGGDAFGFQKIRHEVGIRFDDLALGSPFADASGARRVDIESAFGTGAFNPAGLVQHRHDQIAASLK